MTKTIRWGILGTGKVAADFAAALEGIPGARIAAVASRSAARAREFRDALGDRGGAPARAHGDWEGLARDDEVDIVYVASENTTHRDACIACLSRGKAVLCEKPFTVNASETREVIAEARRRRVFCMEGMWMRFVPLFGEIVDAVRAGAIGDVRMISAQLGMPFEPDPKHRVFDPALGGGALLDLGVYPLSFVFALLGRPASVVARGVVRGPHASGVDEQVAAILGFSEGRQAMVTTSLRNRTTNDATIMGTEGMIRVHEPLYCPEAFTIVRAPKLGGARGKKAPLAGRFARMKRSPLLRGVAAFVARSRVSTVTRRVRGNGMQYEAIEAMRCLREGALESPVMPLDESLAIMETIDEIRRAW